MPNRKRLGLDHPRDLLAKLDWELDQLNNLAQDEMLSSYRAFNCAVTAWSLCDWVWNAGERISELPYAMRARIQTQRALRYWLRYFGRKVESWQFASSLPIAPSTFVATGTMTQVYLRRESLSISRKMVLRAA